MAEPQTAALEAEADDYDNDSSLGDEAPTSSTTSISSSILNYREESGRMYHAYKVSVIVASISSRNLSI